MEKHEELSQDDIDLEIDSILEDALGTSLLDSKASSAFSWGDSDLLEILWNELSKEMHPGDVQMIFDKMRDKLKSSHDVLSLKSVHELTLNCTKCPKLKHSADLPVWNVTNPDLLIISESPRSMQKSWKELTGFLKKAGFSSRRVGLTYLLRCPTQHWRPYEASEVDNCHPYLMAEIKAMQPKLILLLGSVALSSFFGGEVKLKETKGSILWLGPYAFMPLYSMNYVAKATGGVAEDFQSDIIRAYHFLYGDSNE